MKNLPVYNLYNMINTLQCVCFILLARKWEKFLNLWQNVNLIFSDAKIYDMKVRSIRKKLNISHRIFIIVFIIFLILIQVQSYFELKAVCTQAHEVQRKVEIMLRSTFPQFFFLFGYNVVGGVLMMILFENLLFTRMFNDFFIIIVSKLLARKFEVFNEKILLNISVSFSNSQTF